MELRADQEKDDRRVWSETEKGGKNVKDGEMRDAERHTGTGEKRKT